MNRDYTTIKNENSCEIIEKKSRFIATVKKVSTNEQAQMAIEEIKNLYSDASHNTYAFRVNDGNLYQKYSDDNEPKGTAGLPILEVITGNDLENVLIVVTRYFGGTLLGTGGLARAYSKAAKMAVKNAKVVKMMSCHQVDIKCSYPMLGRLQNYLLENNINVINTEFLENVIIAVLMKKENVEFIKNELINLTSGHVEFTIGKEQYMEMEI
ncbi:MAG: YigZ family protein [Clostridia bacterium]|nr:YigZ family protein [Clostridia bacterium]